MPPAYEPSYDPPTLRGYLHRPMKCGISVVSHQCEYNITPDPYLARVLPSISHSSLHDDDERPWNVQAHCQWSYLVVLQPNTSATKLISVGDSLGLSTLPPDAQIL